MRGRICLLLSLLVSASAIRAADPVRLEIDSERRVLLSGLPPMLGDEEIKRHLTTGLTTTFLFHSEVRHEEVTGGARIGVRYELWDEVFHVVVLAGDGSFAHHEILSFEGLAAWWQSLRLAVLDLGNRGMKGPVRVRVTLDVVPFSQSEREDTQRWFTTTISGVARGEEENVARSTEVREDTLEQMFSVLMATSIRSRSLTSYRWTIDVPKGDSE